MARRRNRRLSSGQAYNAQAAVDAEAQIIVAHELTQCGSDQGQLVPLVEAKHVVSTAMSHLDAPSTRQRQTEKLVDR